MWAILPERPMIVENKKVILTRLRTLGADNSTEGVGSLFDGKAVLALRAVRPVRDRPVRIKWERTDS